MTGGPNGSFTADPVYDYRHFGPTSTTWSSYDGGYCWLTKVLRKGMLESIPWSNVWQLDTWSPISAYNELAYVLSVNVVETLRSHSSVAVWFEFLLEAATALVLIILLPLRTLCKYTQPEKLIFSSSSSCPSSSFSSSSSSKKKKAKKKQKKAQVFKPQ